MNQGIVDGNYRVEIYISNKFTFIRPNQGRRSHGDSCPRCLNSAGAARGQHGGSTGAARGQHGGSTGAARGQQVAFLPKLHFERRAFFT
jgi:hypothetical protein